MSKAGEKLIEAAQPGVGQVHFLNVFTGKTEPYLGHSHAMGSSLRAAAERIDDLERQIAEIKAFLAIPLPHCRIRMIFLK